MQLRSYLDDRFHIALFACFASTLNGPLFETSFRHSFLGLKQVNSIRFWIWSCVYALSLKFLKKYVKLL